MKIANIYPKMNFSFYLIFIIDSTLIIIIWDITNFFYYYYKLDIMESVMPLPF